MRVTLSVGILLMAVNVLAQATGSTPTAQAPAPLTKTPAGETGGVTAAKASQEYDAALVRARILLKDNKTKEALAVIEQAIALNDRRWEAYVVAASAYSSQQLFDDAVGMLQSALTRAPEDRKPLIRDALAETRRALLSPLPQPATPGRATPPAVVPTQAEIVLWKTIENTAKPEDLQGYLKAYPNGTFVPIAAARLGKMQDELEWRAAEATHDSNAVKAFVDTHPTSTFNALAQKRYNDLMKAETTKREQEAAAQVALEKRKAVDPTGETWLGQLVYASNGGVSVKARVEFGSGGTIRWTNTTPSRDGTNKVAGPHSGSWSVNVDELTIRVSDLETYHVRSILADTRAQVHLRPCEFKGTMSRGEITLKPWGDGCSHEVLVVQRP